MKGKIKRLINARKKAPGATDSARFANYSTSQLLKMTLSLAYATVRSFWTRHRLASRVLAILMLLLLIFSIFYEAYGSKKREDVYDISGYSEKLLGKPIQQYADSLKFSEKDQAYIFNEGYKPGSEVDGLSSSPKVTASFKGAPDNSATITDPVSNVSIVIKPKFTLLAPKKLDDKLIYPIAGMDATKVYTLKGTGLKEDIIFSKAPSTDLVSFKYELVIPSGIEARSEKDGSIGFYGVQAALLGNVTTASDADAVLLEKARSNSKKSQFLFGIPAPYVVEKDRTTISREVASRFVLDGTSLTLEAKGMKKGSYPLSIDPTIYVESAKKLMRGNNETNTDFDVTNELIQKSQTTGARIDAWSSTTNLTSAVWGQGTAVAGGNIYSAGGVGSGTTVTNTYNTAGTSTYTVPAGVTSVTVKLWGAGGGGGAGGGSSAGGSGGGGGYAKAVIATTPGEGLTVNVGTGGAKASSNILGGSGGGYSAVKRSATFLVQAGGGGGGGGTRGTRTGGNGGAGGGTSGLPGATATGGGGGGGGGTAAAGGTAGSASTGGTAGSVGAANGGGNGAGFASSTCNTAVTNTQGGAGGTGAGGGGGKDTTTCSNGGGGGGGRFGGGGGGSTTSNNRGGGGGGGGSSLTTGSSTVETAGSGRTPGNDTDSDRGGLADGGAGGANTAGATAGDDGIVLISYTTPGSVSSSVYWAEFNTSTNAIQSPNPGDGACSGWCTSSDYDLPAARTGLSLVAYNGYLYAIGGTNSGGTPQTSVYIAKLGANGEPQLWHPTDSNTNNWVYWYTDTSLTNARSQFGAVAYNNRIYLFGGLTTSSTLLTTNTVQVATINPTGTLNAWSTTGMQAITGGTGRYGLSAQVYNDTLYVLGGAASFAGSALQTVEYSKLNSNGTMNAWTSTSSILTAGRVSLGGSFSTIFSGYIYVAGSCNVVNASDYCTSIGTDVQLASINADGSISEFNTILGLSMDRIGYTLIAWQGGLYRLGGCRAQDSGSGTCTDTVLDVDYGVINEEGEASTVATSEAIATGVCNGGSAYNCDLPGPTEGALIGNVLNGSAILNGYLYIWGGCSNATGTGCTSVSRSVIYTSIGSDGSLTKPSSCGTFTSLANSSWCYDTTSLPAGFGAPGVAIANGYLYSIGGFTASGMIGNIYYTAPSTSDGSIGSWSNIALTGGGGMGATSISYPYTFIRANPSSAGTNPYNLFILGGCIGATGIGCPSTGGYTDAVYKCNINTAGAPVAGSCTQAGQMQIGTVPGATSAGLGAMAGTIYANYIYLMGGLAEGATDLQTTRYAKIDNSNNIVNVTSGTTAGGWIESSSLTFYGRRRGAGFGYNGYLYVVGGYDGSGGGGGVLADIEFAKINVSDGSIGSWSVSSVSINQRWGLALAVSNSYAYVIGGCISGSAPTCNSAGWTNSIQEFQIYNNDSGAVRSYSSSSTCAGANTGPCPGASGVDRIGGSSTVMNGYIYYAGGCSNITCATVVANTYYAPIDAYGVVGAWSSGGSLPTAKTWGKLLNTGGTLYYIGGQTTSANTSATSAVYYTSSISSGNPTWSTATKAITNTGGTAQTRSQFGATVWNNRLYVVGGYDSSGTRQATVLVSPRLSSGGNITTNWSSGSTSFNVSRVGLTAVAYANNLYVLGGNDGTNYLSDVQFSQINTTTGDAGSWTYSTNIPNPLSDAEGFAANGYIYLLGGRSAASTCRSVSLFAPISANTTIATGNNPTGVGVWSETNQKYSGDRYGAAASYANGRVYLTGGGCTALVGSADRMYSSTLKAQPQVAKYSRLIDTDTNVFPNSWLMNGVDNSIGARWQASYQSAIDASNVILHQSFDDGSNGSNVSPGNSAYDSCYSNGTLTNQYSNAQSVTGSLSMRLQVSSGSGNGGCRDDTAADVSTRYDRFYIYFSSLPSANVMIYQLSNSADTGFADPIAQVRLTTTGLLQLRDKFTQDAITTTALSANKWHRIEIGTTGGIMTVRVFNGNGSNDPNVTTPTETISDTLTRSSYTTFGVQQVGLLENISSPMTLYVDEHKASASTWVGTAFPGWGQNTSYGDVTLGDVAPYTPLDASGANTSFARWYLFSVSIDASQTFGYPEDVERGPTISDLSLFFTSDPNKRLRHGKTFTGGEQQPLDTPCRQSVDSDCPLP